MRRQPEQRGSIAMIVGLSFIAFMLVAAMAIDIGLARLRIAELQATVDFAAIDGANKVVTLDADNNPVYTESDAVAAAQNSYALNTPLGDTLSAGDIGVGSWDGPATFDPAAATSEAVEISITRSVPTVFSSITGVGAFSVPIYAVARTSWLYPIECGIFSNGDTNIQGAAGLDIDSWDSAGSGTAYGGVFPENDGADTCANGDITKNGNPDVYGQAAAAGSVDCAPFIDSGGNPSECSTTNPVTVPTACEVSATINGSDSGCTADTDAFGTLCTNTGAGGPPYDETNIPLWGEMKPGGSGDFNVGDVGTINGPAVICLSEVRFTSGTFNFDSSGGPIEIWVDGDQGGGDGGVDLGGNGILNTTLDPHDVAIFAQNTGDFDVGGGNDMGALLYSIDGDITYRGNADFYGVMIAQTGDVDLGGSASVHVDESLAQLFTNTINRLPPTLVE